MKSWLARAVRTLHHLEDGILVFLLLTMIGVAVTQIVLRNGFSGGGFLWAESFLRVLVLWIGLAGAMAASREHRHITIDIVGHFLPPRWLKITAVFNALFTAVVAGMVAYFTFTFVKMEYEFPSIAFASVPTWACESIMPIAFSVIALRYFLLALLTPFRAAETHAGSFAVHEVGAAANEADNKTVDVKNNGATK